MEEKLTTGDERETWKGLNTRLIQCSNLATFAEQLTTYYREFDMPRPQNYGILTSKRNHSGQMES